MLRLLAQADTTTEASRLLFYSAIGIGAFLLLGLIVIVFVRNRAQEAQENVRPMLPFTLHDLREMHKAGQLSDEEFQKARDKIVAMSKAALAKKEKKPEPDLRKRDQPLPPAPSRPGTGLSDEDTPAPDDFDRPGE